MERVLERFRRRLCLRVFRPEHAPLLKKNASTMNIGHVSMGADCRAAYCPRRQNMLPDALIVCLPSQKTRGNSNLKPVFHGACFGAVSAPTLSARVPLRASAAFEKERFHYEYSSCFHGADCRAD